MSVQRIAVLFSVWLLVLPPVAVVAAQESVAGQETEAASAVSTQADAALEAQVQELAAKLRCPTCRALSVYDSPSGMAQEMRALIRDQLRSGKTPEEVTAYFVERYGEWILLEPTAEGFNWTVWLLPVLLLAGGLVFVLMTARRWVQHGQAHAVDEGQEREL